MPDKVTEIIIQYKALPHHIFGEGESAEPNRLIIRLQPNEGIEMSMVSKRQSLKDKLSLQTHTLNFDFREDGDIDRIPDAYERLFLDAINGDPSCSSVEKRSRKAGVGATKLSPPANKVMWA